MKDKSGKNSQVSKQKNELSKDFSKNLTQLIEDQSKKISNPFQGLSEKMIISSARDDKKLLLWDERTGGVIFSYEDESIKTFFPSNKILVLGPYSDFIIATQENKSMFLVWKTDTVDAVFKSSPVEERITSFISSYDSTLFFIGTETGKVLIYELFSGNIAASFNAHTEKINDIKVDHEGSVLVTCSTDCLVRLFILESVLDQQNGTTNSVQAKYELLVGNKELLNIRLFGIPTYYIFGVAKDYTVFIIDYPKLTVMKKIYFNELVSSIQLNSEFTDLFIHQGRRLYFSKVEELFSNTGQTITQDNLKKAVESEKMICCFCVGSKYLLVGQEDGIIALYDLFSYKFVQNVHIHRGPVTNILCVNRPISQYGLSFNSKVSNLVVKQLKKSNASYNNIKTFQMNSLNSGSDLIKNHIDKMLDRQDNTLDLKNLENLYNHDNKIVGGRQETVEKPKIYDEKFLQKKLAEAYLLLSDK